MIKLVLYTSRECCLCENALQLINEISADYRLEVKKEDIFRDKSLLIKYRTSIPVIKHKDSGALLFWPFDQLSLRNWIKNVTE